VLDDPGISFDALVEIDATAVAARLAAGAGLAAGTAVGLALL
jgi:hypothetical protein